MPPESLTKNVAFVNDVGSIAWLKVTEMVAALLTPGAPAAGVDAVMVGPGPAVKNEEVYMAARALPPLSLTTAPVPPSTVTV